MMTATTIAAENNASYNNYNDSRKTIQVNRETHTHTHMYSEVKAKSNEINYAQS